MSTFLVDIPLIDPVALHLPARASDATGIYTLWELSDAATFTILLPLDYVPGSEVSIRIEEATPGQSLKHKWQAALILEGTHTETYTAEYTSSATTSLRTTRDFQISTSGTIGGTAISAGDTIAVTLTRVAASSNEDSNSIKVYTLAGLVTLGPSFTTVGGRLGAIFSQVLDIFRDTDQDFISASSLLTWANSCTQDIAKRGYWQDTVAADLTATVNNLDLTTTCTSFVSFLQARWNNVDDSGRSFALKQLSTRREFAARQNLSVNQISTKRPRWCYQEHNTLYFTPTPTSSQTGGLSIDFAYCPADFDGSTNVTPAFPAEFDDIYVWHLLAICSRKDRGAKTSPTDFQMYMGLFERALNDLIFQGMGPVCARPYR